MKSGDASMFARCIFWGLVAGLFLAAALPRNAQAEDETTYDLRGPAPAAGQVLRTKMKLKIQDADTTVTFTGEKPIKMKLTMELGNEKEQKFLQVYGRSVIRCQCKIIEDRSTVTIEGSSMPKTSRGVLEGTTVLSELNEDSKWKNSLVDAVPAEAVKKELEDYIGMENSDDLYPAEKIKTGHTWTSKANSLGKLLGSSFNDITGELKQQFVKVEKFGDAKCAVVESTGTLKCKMKDEGGSGSSEVEMELKVILWRSLESGVELKETIDGKIKFSGPQKVDSGETVNVTLSGPIKGESITSISMGK
jgi:hypothetical protein